jgi:hypothetical protein
MKEETLEVGKYLRTIRDTPMTNDADNIRMPRTM